MVREQLAHAARFVVERTATARSLEPYDGTEREGYFVAIGTSGNQFKNAPPVGHLMAELIDACEKGHEHDGDPVQVTMPYTGVTLNAGFYSRLRDINENSSFSVNG